MNYFKKLIAAGFLILSLSFLGYSQQLLIPYRDGALWGYADTSGRIQIRPAYDKVEFFNFNKSLAEVYRDKKVSLVDTAGRLLFPFSDSYYQFAGNYIVIQGGKKGIYSGKGIALLPIEYDGIECTCAYEKYEEERDKIIAIKDKVYYLVTPSTSAIKKIPRPERPQLSGTSEGVVAVPYNKEHLTSVPHPQRPSSDFPRLASYKDLVHCETIYRDGKPLYYVFCVWKDRQKIGYMGQNGVAFYND